MLDDDSRGHRHRFRLVVRDVDEGRSEPLVELDDLGAGLDAQLGVEVRQRLVEEEDGGLADDRAAQGHALSLAAGECAGLALEQVFDAQNRRRLVDARLDLLLRCLA